MVEQFRYYAFLVFRKKESFFCGMTMQICFGVFKYENMNAKIFKFGGKKWNLIFLQNLQHRSEPLEIENPKLIHTIEA